MHLPFLVPVKNVFTAVQRNGIYFKWVFFIGTERGTEAPKKTYLESVVIEMNHPALFAS